MACAMLDSIGDAVIATDTKGHITLINPAASSLTGFAQVEALGRNVTSLLNIVNEATKTTVGNPLPRSRARCRAHDHELLFCHHR